jgi:lysophospholipase
MRLAAFIFIAVFFNNVFALTDLEYKDLVNELTNIKNKKQASIDVKLLSFLGTNAKRVNFTRFSLKQSGTKGSIVISVGRAESSISYYETAKSFLDLGYSPIFVIDHRGQGLSERILGNGQKSHVEKFRFYANDFKIFINHIVKNEVKHNRLFLITHSMGSAVAADGMMRHRLTFKAVSHVAPMFKLVLEKSEAEILEDLETYCAPIIMWTGLCNMFIPGGGAFNSNVPFEKNRLTNDENRYKFMYKSYELWPSSRIGSVTLNWVKETIPAIKEIRHNSNRVDAPTLLLQAANDTIVDNSGQNTYCYRALDCELVVLENSKHGIFKEVDTIRDEAILAIDLHFKNNL